MKSERRHELQHNELADWLAKSAEAIKPYQNVIFVAVLAVLVAAVGYTWWSRQSAAETTKAWDTLNAAIESGDPVQFAKVMDDYPNTTMAHMAMVVLADYHLAGGCNQRFVNKATAQDELNKAIKLYDSVRHDSRVPSLVERAKFGLARAHEAKGELDPAEKLYAEISKQPNGTYTAAANQRLEDLKRPVTRRFYDQFANFDPKPAFLDQPGERPSFDLNSVPEEGPVYMPKSTYGLKLDDTDTGKEEAKGKEPAKAKEETKGKPPAKK